jgi:transcription elongation factor
MKIMTEDTKTPATQAPGSDYLSPESNQKKEIIEDQKESDADPKSHSQYGSGATEGQWEAPEISGTHQMGVQPGFSSGLAMPAAPSPAPTVKNPNPTPLGSTPQAPASGGSTEKDT